ncbi:molybdopterin molybdenumtransferase MoeA [Pelagivirga sediminicola]|uniref:Molybdopterin molybdenumtransferase n=1 Tax=Pelagivirga sediminicola TaxID=2170575 RepID=A0A2T7G4T5_9RHOB|nr:gephyrin-like molybdotransferase Glp [Pelagivirga sediminicola]PVA09438.1 molybdopterin molybdenumtransferase MoeA [Pelagivirga sediminicola]
MRLFDTVLVVDWSARAAPSPAKPGADAIWTAAARGGAAECSYHRTRAGAMQAIDALLEEELAAGRRVLAGFDFPFGYPRGFARALTGTDDPLALWAELAARIVDGADNANNRFDVARAINAALPGIGPFWGGPEDQTDATLPAKGSLREAHGLPERRACEMHLPGAQSCWKLYTTGSVGSQALLGIPRLQALRERFGAALSVAPFEAPDTPIVLAEVYPSLLAPHVAAQQEPGEIKDRAQVRVLAEALHGAGDALDAMLREGDAEEGWILGLGHEARLAGDDAGMPPAPPPLRDDCFAMPAGVDWTPVDDALAALRAGLHPVARITRCKVADAAGRVLAEGVAAARANPPTANSAIDGYGFAHDSLPPGDPVLPLVAGRAAAGAPYGGTVPPGHAIRILTGAAIPGGVDTVILEEDTRRGAGQIAFRGGIKPRANTRKAGEDVTEGAEILPRGRVLTPADLALMAATGLGEVAVFERLRVAVLSTGDELVEAGGTAGTGQIFDANRPMLLALLRGWGMEAIDIGRIPDDRGALRAALDDASARANVVLTSGGASAGDEDHVSALLREAGAMQQWRIALKPGRPLALGLWQGAPVFGLPGNPVAALVCTLIFARPALGLLAGAGWQVPQGFDVPAAFGKSKKAGRREYLRARIQDGRAEVFASEGSGRISGLSWAEGLVELPDGAATIRPGDPVRYLPFGSFTL